MNTIISEQLSYTSHHTTCRLSANQLYFLSATIIDNKTKLDYHAPKLTCNIIQSLSAERFSYKESRKERNIENQLSLEKLNKFRSRFQAFLSNISQKLIHANNLCLVKSAHSQRMY